MSFGDTVLWRFFKDKGAYRFGYVCELNGLLVKIAPYNGATNGVWVKESEVEWEPYVK